MAKKLKIGVLTVSDRPRSGVNEDKGGPAVVEELKALLTTPFEPVSKITPDERKLVEKALRELARSSPLIITTGGTGPSRRDVTPEATSAVCDKMLPGFGELMREVSLKKVPTAILSRQTAGIRGKSLIINLPGKPSAIKDCLRAVMPAVPDCLHIISGLEVKLKGKTHLPHTEG
jgi:molybdopterin adenylyltransferase